jgi:Zn-dependent protease
MRGATKIFRLFGIDIKLHYSWWFIFILLSWSLASSFFPHFFPDYDVKTYWFMGVIAALLLFISVLLHELSHSLVARAKKIKVESITLFFFGGVAGIDSEDMKPSSEFQMAIAGPLFSLILAGIFYLIYVLNGNGVITAITFYLYQLNLILALFNLVPGFPLDGGRAFRAILYAHYKDLRKATRIAVGVGKFFAGFLIILGLIGMFTDSGGLWFILIGVFLYFIAGISYDQVVLKQVLDKVMVDKIVDRNFKSVDAKMNLDDFVSKFSNNGDVIFVIRGNKYLGMLDLELMRPLNKKVQGKLKLRDVSIPFEKIESVKLNDTVYKAFQLLSKQNLNAIPVMKGKQLVGILTKQAIANKIFWEMKFYGEGRTSKVRKITIKN